MYCSSYDPSLFLTDENDSRVATVVIRGSTANIMDDVERTVDDAVNSYKSLTKDPRFVPGGGATEIELAKQLTSYGEVGVPPFPLFDHFYVVFFLL